MKRIKPWKRWAAVGRSMLVIADDDVDPVAEGFDNEIKVLLTSDYRKIMAVFNAAMKYEKTPTFLACKTLQEACERARK